MGLSTSPGLRITQLFYEDSTDPYRVTRRIDPNGAITDFTYTADGNLKTVTDPKTYVTTYTYAEEIDSPLNPKHRNLVRMIQRPAVEVNGVTVIYDPTELRYDSNGNLVKVIDAKAQETVMTYATDGLLNSITDRNGNTTTMVYEGTPFSGSPRRLIEIRVPKGLSSSDGFRSITLEYTDADNIDNVTKVISAPGSLNHSVSTVYDAMDRPVTVTDARSKVSSFDYLEGLLEEVTLPANNGSGASRKTQMVYDSRGRVEEVLRDVSSSTQQSRVKYLYDVISQLKDLTRLKNGVERSFSFEYDQFGRQTSMKDPLANQNDILWELDCSGFTETTARDIRRQIGKDVRCQLTEVKAGNPFGNESFNPLREERTFSYDSLRRMVQSTQTKESKYGKAIMGVDLYGDATEDWLYTYNELDRVVERRLRTDGDPMGANDKVMSYVYDPEGNVTKMTDTEDKVTRYEYFRDNLLHKVILERAGVPDRVFEYAYDPAGRLDKIVYPASTDIEAVFRDEANLGPAGIGTGFDPNGNLRFLRYQKKSTGALIRRFEWTYDDSNNRESMLDVSPTKAVKWEYGVDWLDRLVSVKRAEAVAVANLPASPLGATYLQREYVFDESDNRTFFDDRVAGMSYHYLYKSIDDNGTTRYSDQIEEIRVSSNVGERNPANFTSLETLQHDADGNMTHRIKAGVDTEYKWDDFDRLKRVESTENAETTRLQDNRYDVNGIRKRKLDRSGNSSTEYTAGITTSVSKGGSGSSAAPTISYVMGHMLLGAEIDGVFRFHLMDAQGSVRDVVDDSGAVVKSFEFQEHGLPISSSGSGTFSPKTYQGGLSVNDDTNDSGLYLMGHRHFASDLGRFISRDPIGFRGGLNLYNGAGANPVSRVDPSGLDPTLTIASDPSHAWLKYENLDTDESFQIGTNVGEGAVYEGYEAVLGLWEGKKESWNGDTSSPLSTTLTRKLTPEQDANFRKWVEKNLKSRGWGLWDNCVDFAIEGWREAGQDLNRSFDVTLGVALPARLANDIQRAKLPPIKLGPVGPQGNARLMRMNNPGDYYRATGSY